MKSILVTGGAGYIGSHTIVELLNNGYEVTSIDNFYNSTPKVFNQIYKLTGKKVKNYKVDLCDHKKLKNLFKGKKFDAIIHFAAFKAVGDSVKNPMKYYENNLGALFGILSLKHICHIPSFIYSSSATVYDQNEKTPFVEKSRLNPLSPYGMTKKIGEEILKDYFIGDSSSKIIILRYFNPIGAHPSLLIGENSKELPNNLLPVITNSLKEKKPFMIFGNDYKTPDKTCIRDYIHIVDVARAHISALKFLEKNKNGIYDIFNIGTGKGTSVLEIIKSFEEYNKIKLNFIFKERRQGDAPILLANVKKAEKILGFKSKFTIKEMVETALAWDKKI